MRGDVLEMTRRRLLLGAGVGAASLAFPFGRGKAAGNGIKIGVLTDMAGPFREISGPDSVAATKLAAAEFMAANPSIPVEVIVADHQNKVDLAVSIVRGWYDNDGVDMINDFPNSAIALGAIGITADKNKVAIASSGGTALITGEKCNANTVHWTQDSWNVAHTAAAEIVKSGGKSWYVIAPNLAYGKSFTSDLGKFVADAGGSVTGSQFYPFPETTDFSSFILQAQSSGAQVVCFGYGGQDMVNFMKQAKEFGLNKTARLAGPAALLNDIIQMGLDLGQGLLVSSNFYWDLNDGSRAFTQRFKPTITPGSFPNVNHASCYAGTLHYLKAVKELGLEKAKASGRDTVDMMKKMPTEDDCFGKGSIRIDGRKLQPSYLLQVKAPAESKGPGDVCKLVATTSAESAFRPLSEGGCPLVKT